MQSMASLEELIAAHPFFGGLEPRFVSLLEPCASLRRFGSHQLIFEQGGDADHFYLILSGKVILETFAKDRSTIPIQTLGDGDALGWSWLFPPYQWCFTAATAAPTETISFGADQLRQRAEMDVEFGNDLLKRVAKTLAQRLQATRHDLVQLFSSKVESIGPGVPKSAVAGGVPIL